MHQIWTLVCLTILPITGQFDTPSGHFRCLLPVLRRKHNRRYIVGEFLLNDFRFWNEIQCFKRQAEFIANSGGSGMYSATDEEILHDKARLICDQFLSSQILPKEYGFWIFFGWTKFHSYRGYNIGLYRGYHIRLYHLIIG